MAWAEPLRGGGYRGRYYDQHSVKQSVLNAEGKGFKTEKIAKRAAEDAAAAQRRTATAAGKNKGNEHISPSITWGEWWDALSGARTFDDTETARVERSIVETHLRPRWGATPLNEIKHLEVKNWVKYDLKPRPKMSAAYVRRIFAVFSVTFRSAMDADPPILDATPCAGVPLPRKVKARKRFLTTEAKEKMDGHLREDFQAIVDFGLETGLRPGELCGLHADQVDERRGWMTVTNVFVTRKNMIRPYPKDRDAREVPLTDRALELFQAAVEGRDLWAGCGVDHTDGSVCESIIVFLTIRGRPISPALLTHHMKRSSRQAKVGTLTPYTIRRGFATRAAEGGLSAFELSDSLGHESLEQSQAYVQRTAAARQRLIGALGSVGQKTPLRGVEGNLHGSSANARREPTDDV